MLVNDAVLGPIGERVDVKGPIPDLDRMTWKNRLVIVPVELSVKLTVKGFNPLVGAAVKAAAGTMEPVPVTGLVLLPALLLEKVTALLKLATLPGANWTTTFVEPKPGRLKGVPEIIENGPALMVAVPLLSGALP